MNDQAVYLIRAVGTNRYRIGMTANIQQRLTKLQQASPLAIALVWLHHTDYPEQLEYDLQRRFASQHLHSDWFKLTQVQAQWIVRRAAISFGKTKVDPNVRQLSSR